LVDPYQRFGVFFVAAAQSRSAPDFWFTSGNLLIGLFLIIVSQGSHRRPRDEFTNVGEETLTVVMPSIRSKRESGVSQTPKVAHGLTVSWSSKPGILLNGLLQPCVSNLALSQRLGDTPGNDQRSHEQGPYGLHCNLPFWQLG
jgi:hypothetical protein